MKLFNNLKRKKIASRILEEQLYEKVVNELQQNVRKNGLWAKAIAKSQGDEAKAKALYISLRVQSLMDELEIRKEQVQEEIEAELEKKRQKEESLKKIRILEEIEKRRTAEYEANPELFRSKEVLTPKGYRIVKTDYGWLIHEPLGGRHKVYSDSELLQYAQRSST
jgi:ribosomal protein S8